MGGEGDRPVDAYLRDPWFLLWGLLAGTEAVRQATEALHELGPERRQPRFHGEPAVPVPTD